MSAGSSTVAGRRPRVFPHDARAPGLSLRDAGLVFLRQRTAHVAGGLLLASGIGRMIVGGWSVWDLVVLASFVALHPFAEWVIHVGLLHWRSRRWRGFTVDFELAREHRAHHQRPHDPRTWYIPLRSGLVGYGLLGGLMALVAPTVGLWLTGVAMMSTMCLLYEWTHHLCHSSYRPRGAIYRRLWRQHRLHHFKNEHYWMGVTMHLGDRVLGTRPKPGSVPTSPTCRDLLG
ncbi:MAG: sterol desaturase family protein [Deltaproteobacteria bacterium]|nr:sterol desaturase family protein [Deltaproteobacteria bacterium]